MTRVRAVELLKGIQFCCDFDDCTNAWDCDECVEALNMAIEALEQEPSCRNTRQVDLISRHEVLRGYQSVCKDIACHECRAKDVDGVCRLESFINNMPSAEPNPFCALADRECPFQGKEFAWCLTCPHISEEDRALVKKVASEPKCGR